MSQNKFEIGDRIQITNQSMFLCAANGESACGEIIDIRHGSRHYDEKIVVLHDTADSEEHRTQVWHFSRAERENPLVTLAKLTKENIINTKGSAGDHAAK